MEIRQKIIYAIFAAAVAYGVYFHVFTEEGLLSGNKRALPPAEQALSPTFATTTLSETIPLGLTEKRSRSAEYDWIKDPFRNDKDVKKVRNTETRVPVRKVEPPKLSAISNANGVKMAIVNGNVMQIGDKTGAWRLEDLTDNAALFSGPQGSVWIKLGG